MNDEIIEMLKRAEIERPLKARISELEAEVERLKEALTANTDACHDAVHRLADMTSAAEAEVERLREALTEAIQEVEFWAGYAPEYFREKHDYKGSIAKLRAAIDAARESKA